MLTRGDIEGEFQRDPSGRGVLLGIADAMAMAGVDVQFVDALQTVAMIVCPELERLHKLDVEYRE